jgi:dipeptidyl aminopeptidase/acylaminoacyl peptidase
MSPEQARGLPIDHRTDIFSFGAVLYEMVSGRSAFRAGSTAETLSRILKEDPPDLEAGLSTTIPGLVGIVRRCLEKRPEDRFHSAHDLALALESLTPASHPTVALTAHRSRSWLRSVPFWLAVVATVLAFIAGYAWKAAGTSDPGLQARRLTFRKGAIWSARFAPDGATVVYSAAWGDRPTEVFVTRPDALDDRPLGVSSAVVLAVSEQEVLVKLQPNPAQHGSLARVPLAGGTPRRVLETVQAADFGPGGREVAAANVVEGRNRIEFPLGTLLHEAAGRVTALRVAPSGERLAFLEQIGESNTRLVVVDRSTRTARTLLTGEAMVDIAWASDDSLWTSARNYGSAGTIQVVDLAGRTRTVRSSLGRVHLHDLSRAGRALLAEERRTVELYAVLDGEARERNLTWLDGTTGGDLSPDGRRFLFTEQETGGGPRCTAYLRTMDGALPTRLREGWAIALSPDAGRALVREDVVGAPLWLVPTGAGPEIQLPLGSLAAIHWAWWFPDGQRILIQGQERDRPVRLFVQTLPKEPPVALTTEGTGTVWSYPISPDGRHVIVHVGGSETPFSIYSLGDGTTRPISGLRPADTPLRWSGDGRHLFVHAGRQGFPVAIERLDLGSGQREKWRELPVPDPAGMLGIGAGAILLTPDGRTALYHGFRIVADLYLVEGLR